MSAFLPLPVRDGGGRADDSFEPGTVNPPKHRGRRQSRRSLHPATKGVTNCERPLAGNESDRLGFSSGSIPPVQVTQKQSVKLRTTCRGGPRSQYPEQRQLESARGAPPNCRFMGVTSRRLQGETSLEYLYPSSVRDQRKAARRIRSVGGARTA